MTKVELADKIDKFLATYGKRSADDKTEWNSPDASELEVVAKFLRKDFPLIRFPWSDWGSGGYGPYASKEGREEHDEILKLVQQVIEDAKREAYHELIRVLNC